MVPCYDSSQDRGRQSANNKSIPVDAGLSENWKGKSDAQERRRIQNRLNQRAFRQRQRSGEPSRTYKKRSCPQKSSQSRSPSGDNETGEDSEGEEALAQVLTGTQSLSRNDSNRGAQPAKAPVNSRSTTTITATSDELAHLIKRNLYTAATSNAQLIGLDLDALKNATWVCTPRTFRPQDIPSALRPIEAQHQIPHDPFIDTIPDPRLRYNILRAITRQQFDPVAFSTSLRQSGVLEEVNGIWQRGGLVVWNSPELIANWEVSEPFARRWDFLFEGCDDLIAATNRWRRERDEKLFPPSLAAQRHTSP